MQLHVIIVEIRIRTITSSQIWVRSIAMSVSVCLSVCLSVCSFTSETTCPDFMKFSLGVICGRGSVLL